MMIIMRFFVPVFLILFAAVHIEIIGLEIAPRTSKTAAAGNGISKIETAAQKIESPKTTSDLVKLLGNRSKWFTYRNAPIIKRLPGDFSKIAAGYRKRVFIAAILPLAVVVKKQFDTEHQYVIDMRNKIRRNAAINSSEKEKLDRMFYRYKIKRGSLRQKINKLWVRTGSVPISLILAQAAIESNWGASRFTIKGNNLFGIRTYSSRGMRPRDCSDCGQEFRVVAYKNLESSIRSYIINFNTGWAYKELRKTRSAMYPNDNPYIFADKLIYYSIKRNDYIRTVKNIIGRNNFERFDKNHST